MTIARLGARFFFIVLALAISAPTYASQSGPTAAQVQDGDRDAASWVTYNKGLLGYRYSSLTAIDSASVSHLRKVCSFNTGWTGNYQNGPVVWNGLLYTTTGQDTFAINASTCHLVWKNHYAMEQPSATINSKGAAIADGRIFRGTPDGRLIAIDATTGHTNWIRKIMDPTNGEFATAAPLVWNGLIYIGKAGADRGIRGQMMAFRESDGSHVWTFNTVPNPGQVGSDTWKNPLSMKHGGGSTWTSYSLDPELGLIFVPVGNPGPDFDKAARPGNNLFTNSVVALDARTGALRWWKQLNPADDKDWDADVVAAFDTSDGRKLLAEAGKDAVLHVMDRATGKMQFSVPMTRQLNIHTAVTAGKGIRVCPIAGVQWNGPAFDSHTNLLYMNSIDWCAQAIKGPTPVYRKGQEYLGWQDYYGKRDPIAQAYGWVNAIDVKTHAIKWRYRTPSPPLAAITVTAGGLLLTGDTAGHLYAIDSTSGQLEARIGVGKPLGAGLITYSVHGSQYIAVAGGITNATYGTKGTASIVIYGR